MLLEMRISLKNAVAVAICTSITTSFPLAVFAQVTADDLKKGSPPLQENKPTLQLSEVQMKSLQLMEAGKLKEAREFLEDSIDKADNQDPELIYLLSVFLWKEQKYKDCAKRLASVQEAYQKTKSLNTLRNILLKKREADCYYQDRVLGKAEKLYIEALNVASKLPSSKRISVTILENLVGTLMYSKEFDEAEVRAKELLSLTSELAEAGSVNDIASKLWAQLQLMNIYKSQNKEEERLKFKDDVVVVLNQLMTLRSDLDEAGKIPDMEVFRKLFLNQYIKSNKPKTLAEYLWLAAEYKPHSLPLIEWRTAKGMKTEAVILCIHGLGLDNTAYAPFGKQMAKRGYTVYAMDVRGFGSWLTIPGQEDVGFDDTLRDINGVVKLIKERHPNSPIYLLGESMGGGIVLRAGAKFGDIVDGIIASVPSAERFQGKRMGLTVAAHFLRDSNRPFNIGHTVATQATTNEALQDAWEESFKSKMKMTPVELMKFAVFMRTTLMHCKDIKETPVFIVQGLKDRLVKPQGTYKMFDAVKSEDKTMVIVGTAEHLIFENDKQSKILLDSLCSWLDNHSQEVQ